MNKRNLTMQDFFSNYEISKSSFYRMLAAGEGPKTVKIGKRRLVPVQAAEEWMRSFETAGEVMQ